MWSLFFKGRKNKRKSSKARQEVTQIEERVVRKHPDSPRTPDKNYLTDETWDILPKTGYTYAQSGSYSPRFFGKKYVQPNMSRYRIRNSRKFTTGSYMTDEVDGEYDEFDYSDYETEDGMETVLHDGMELRNGKNLYLLEEHYLEQEAQRNSSSSSTLSGSARSGVLSGSTRSGALSSVQSSTKTITDMNYSAKTRSEKKTRKSEQNQRQLSQSERKRYSTSNVDSYSGSTSLMDYNNTRARRNLDNSYSTNSNDVSNSSYSQSLHARKSTLNNSNASRSEFEENNSSLRRKGRYSVKTVQTLVTEEFADYENNGVLEKGSVEPSEKQSSSSVSQESSQLSSSEGTGRQTQSSRYIKSMYGLDDEFSEGESEGSYLTRRSYGGDSPTDGSRSTVTTIVTTVTETVTTITRAVVSPVWNTVGRPVVTYVAEPTWSYVVRPAMSTVTSIVTSVLLVAWSVLTWPVKTLVSAVASTSGVTSIVTSVPLLAWSVLTWPVKTLVSAVASTSGVTSIVTSILSLIWSVLTWPVTTVVSAVVSTSQAVSSWFWDTDVGGVTEKVGSVFREAWSVVETVVRKFVLLDMWLFKRRRGRGCCLCLPLLLLLPLLLALYAGRDVIDTSAITAGLSSGLSAGLSAGYMGVKSSIGGVKSSIVGIKSSVAGVADVFSRESSPPPIMVTENKEYATQLNDIRTMILQYQDSHKDQLTAGDVEAIVYRILNKQSDALKADLEGTIQKDQQTQVQWKAEQDVRLGDMKSRHDELLAVIKDLESTIASQHVAMATQGEELKAESSLYLTNLEEKLAVLQAELRDLEKEHAALLLRVNACCQNETYYAGAIKDNVNTILAQMMAGHMSGNPSQDAFTEWLHSNYVSRDTLDTRLKELSNDLTTNVLAMIQDLQQKQQADAEATEAASTSTASQANYEIHGNVYGIGEQQVRLMIEEALFKYSADRTGIPDFALESAGGTVVSTRCSETYDRRTGLIKVFGLPLWYVSNSPRTVLQPDVYPGQCWAFKGPTGYIVIQTSTIITPTGFTLEHIPKSLAPSGEIDSAPKYFTVLGLIDEYDDKGTWFGNYTYNDDGNPIQYFPVTELKGERTVFNLFELRILDNYGNPQYTCLYRFRIHGKPYRP